MDRQSTIAFILIGIILVVWLYFNSPAPMPTDKKDIPDTTEIVNNDLPDMSDENSLELEQTTLLPDSLITNNSEPEIITIENDKVLLELTTQGARIRRYFLKEQKTWYYKRLGADTNFYSSHVQLINTKKNGGDLSAVFATKDGNIINSKDLVFDKPGNTYKYSVSGDKELKLDFVYYFNDNSAIIKTYIISGNDYAFKYNFQLKEMQSIISGITYDLVWESGINFTEINSVDEANYSNASVYSGEEQLVVNASSVGEVEDKEFGGKIDWVGVRTKYFGVIISPDVPNPDGGAYIKGEHVSINGLGDREYYETRLMVPIENPKNQKNDFLIYLGPIDYHILGEYEGKNFQAIYDFGSFLGLKFITKPISEYILLPLFVFLNRFIPNYGVVILIFTLIIKLLISPLTRQSYKSMGKMQKLQPKIAELKEKYKDDPQEMQKQTMQLYSKYGINPMGGCLPMVLQMPILFALFTFFNVAIQIRNQPFVLWIDNLSIPDVLFTLPFQLPLLGIQQISGLALLLGVSMFLSNSVTMKDPQQKQMAYLMPIFLTLMFMNFPSGLNLYYFAFNILTFAQQKFFSGKDSEELTLVDKPKKGFMERMMEQAEQQKQVQRTGGKPKPKKKKF